MICHKTKFIVGNYGKVIETNNKLLALKWSFFQKCEGTNKGSFKKWGIHIEGLISKYNIIEGGGT
jgi:hypothetical protein